MNRRHALLLPLLPVSLTSMSAFAQNRRDGHYWRTLPELTKLHIALGVLHAYIHAGDVVGYVACQKPNAAVWGCAAEALQYEIASNKLFGNLSLGQIVEGLDAIYSDYKNLNILIAASVLHVAKVVAGMPKTEAEANLESLRRLAAK